MRILTPDNTTFTMEEIPNYNADLMYGVMDYSNKDDVDYYFLPLIFLDSYPRAGANLRIGDHNVVVPLDWSLVIIDRESAIVETMEIKSINDREFDALCVNPISGFTPSFLPITVTDIYQEINWFTPKLKNGHFLVVPLEETDEPLCALFIKEFKKVPDQLDISVFL